MNLDELRAYANRVKETKTGVSKGKYAVTNVAGVTFEGRQQVLDSVCETTKLKLVRDKSNQFDFFAIEVRALINDAWKQVGFIPKTISKKFALELDKGETFPTRVLKVTGESPKGLLIRIEG